MLAALLLSISCGPVSQYDEAPTFVKELGELKTQMVKKGMEAPTGFVPVVEAAPPVDLPGWFQDGDKPLLPRAGERRQATLDDLFVTALKHSHQIRVFADMPVIRETGVREAEGVFDFHAFVQPSFDHVNEPVGNALVSATRDRLVEDSTSTEFGIRKKLDTGADLSVAERLSHTRSTADFFVPGRQAASTLTVRLVQPLLSGAGVRYNSSVLHLARLDGEIAQQELLRQVEAHLLEIARAYWTLYSARAVYAQYTRQAETTRGILEELKARANADALRHQILRAESSLAERRADMVRAELAILNAQERLRALINEDAGWAQAEIIPTTPLHRQPIPVDRVKGPGAVALEKRPEIKQAFLQLRAAAVRLGMNENDVLPRLNLILEGRLAGLGRGMDFGRSFGDQGDVGDGGGLVGLLFEVPLGNNAGEARLIRREMEMRQQFSQIRTTIDTILLEVRISERETDAGFRDFVAKNESANAAREEVAHLLARKDVEAMRAPASSYILDLMEAQDRQVSAERALAQSLATYQVAALNLQRAQGMLLEVSAIAPVRSMEGNLPMIRMEKKTPP